MMKLSKKKTKHSSSGMRYVILMISCIQKKIRDLLCILLYGHHSTYLRVGAYSESTLMHREGCKNKPP